MRRASTTAATPQAKRPSAATVTGVRAGSAKKTVAVATHAHGIEPRRVSFTGAKQAVTAFAPKLEAARPEGRPALIDAMLTVIAYHSVGDRPERWEPRARKRRRKPGAHLRGPRAVAKQAKDRSKWFQSERHSCDRPKHPERKFGAQYDLHICDHRLVNGYAVLVIDNMLYGSGSPVRPARCDALDRRRVDHINRS